MNRPTQDEYFLSMAKLAGRRSNCLSRQVGCVLVDKNNIVLATGYNGVPAGFQHCSDGGCPRLGAKSGENLEACLAIHAERNALMFCSDVFKIDRLYVTSSPCLGCMVMIMNTGCKHIIFEELYDQKALQLWQSTGREWTHADTDVSNPVGMETPTGITRPFWCK